MKLLKVTASILAGLILTACSVHAQGVGASGDIRGTVTDPTGAVISKATVTATEVEKGIKRTTVSDDSGLYLISGLAPAKYNVSAEISGFQTMVQTGVEVTVGEIVTLDFHLKLSQTAERVEVSAEVPVVETTRGSQADTIDQQYIADLPINRRDYLTFTLLAPGVSNSTRLASDQDFRVKQTPQSGLSFYGSNGRGNSVTVDGGEFNDDSGGVRLTVSQEAVQEFQVNRSNYGADLGGASGASINIVTKSGTNNIHGSFFGFFRDDPMDARNPFSYSSALTPASPFNLTSAATPVKDSLNRQQYGGSVGGPIRKGKTFFFVSFEGLHQASQNAVPLLTNSAIFGPDPGTFTGNNQLAIITGLAAEGSAMVPCLTGMGTIPANICAGTLQSILTVNPAANLLNKFLVNQFETNGGLLPYGTHEYFASARLDHQFSDRDQVYFRYAFGHDVEESPDVQSLVAFSAGSSLRTYDHTIQGSWFHEFSSAIQNEFRVQFDYADINIIPNEPSEVGLAIPGFGNFGTNIFQPSLSILRRIEFADNMTLIHGHHTMKFGFYELYRGDHTESHTFFPGRFVFGNLPGGILSPCLQVPAACGLPATTNPVAINGLQSAALEAPQFYQQGFGNPTYNYPRPLTAAYWQDQWQIFPSLTFTYGLRYEVDTQSGTLNTDQDNFAPRASFAWDPFKNQKTVVRGGFGIFFSPVYGQIADVVQTLGNINGTRQIANILVPLTGNPGITPPAGACTAFNASNSLTSQCIFGTLFAQGLVTCTKPTAGNAACITPANLTQFGINIANTGPLPPLTVLFSGQKDYQSPYSEQAEFGIEREIAPGFSVSVSGIYVHTLRLPVALDTNLLPAPFTTATSPFTGKQVTFQNWAAPQCKANPFLCFANPFIVQNNQYSSVASALYYGGIIEVKKRFSEHFTLLFNYTYSHAYDTTTDYNSDFSPFNQLNLAADRGLSDFDQRHKVVFAGVLDSGHKSSMLFGGWQLSPIVSYNSGHPFNVLAAGTDINGDNHSTNDRPLGIGRNSGLGPAFAEFDGRLTRTFRLCERSSIQLTAEAFNITNHTNYASVNNEVPTLNGFANIGAHPTGVFVNPSLNSPGGTPLAFTSAYPKRQLQLGFRFIF